MHVLAVVVYHTLGLINQPLCYILQRKDKHELSPPYAGLMREKLCHGAYQEALDMRQFCFLQIFLDAYEVGIKARTFCFSFGENFIIKCHSMILHVDS